jgi:hypothetical protein
MSTEHVLYGLDFQSSEPCSIEIVRGYLQIKTEKKEHMVKSTVPWPTLLNKLRELGITLKALA